MGGGGLPKYSMQYLDTARFAIILVEKRELVALLNLSSWCLVIVVWFFLAVPWVCLQFVISIFHDHTHLLFLGKTNNFFTFSRKLEVMSNN